MKQLAPIALLGLAFMVFPVEQAQATCRCVCLEGQRTTVCDDVASAQSDVDMCLTQSMEYGCPVPDGQIDTTVTDPFPDDTTSCERKRIFDPASQTYAFTAKVCEVVALSD